MLVCLSRRLKRNIISKRSFKSVSKLLFRFILQIVFRSKFRRQVVVRLEWNKGREFPRLSFLYKTEFLFSLVCVYSYIFPLEARIILIKIKRSSVDEGNSSRALRNARARSFRIFNSNLSFDVASVIVFCFKFLKSYYSDDHESSVFVIVLPIKSNNFQNFANFPWQRVFRSKIVL